MHRVFRGDNARGNVVFNFLGDPIDDLAAFARGYHDAGRLLAHEMASAQGYRDFDGYPILYIYRHALELYLKAVVYRGAQLVHLLDVGHIDTSKLFQSHRLSSLLPALTAVLESLDRKGDFETPRLQSYDELADLVRGVDEIDPDSFAFRYPITKGQGPAIERHTVLNAVAFAEHLDPVLDLLDGAVTGLDEEFDASAEARHEIEQLIRGIGEPCGVPGSKAGLR